MNLIKKKQKKSDHDLCQLEFIYFVLLISAIVSFIVRFAIFIFSNNTIFDFLTSNIHWIVDIICIIVLLLTLRKEFYFLNIFFVIFLITNSNIAYFEWILDRDDFFIRIPCYAFIPFLIFIMGKLLLPYPIRAINRRRSKAKNPGDKN